MYSIGEYVVCGNKGVCKVENITTLDISGVNKEEQYYILKPVYNAGSTMYVQVDLADESVRPILSHEQANLLVGDIPQIPELFVENDKYLENEYKGCIRSNDARELVKVLKTIYARRLRRFAAGRKETAVDAKYFRLAEDYLFGELAIALDMPKGEVNDFICASGWGEEPTV